VSVKRSLPWSWAVLFISTDTHYIWQGPSWSWSYGNWIYNYLWNQYLSPLTLWAQSHSWRGLLDTLCDKVCQWLAIGWWFSPGTPVSSTNITDSHNITEILLKLALNSITLTSFEHLYHLDEILGKEFHFLDVCYQQEIKILQISSIIVPGIPWRGYKYRKLMF
jgi:hypothetical protein